MDNDLKIMEAENGFILTSEVENEEGKKEFVFTVVEEIDGECIKRLLEKVAEHFGVAYNKFSANNLNITFDKKGHKVES